MPHRSVNLAPRADREPPLQGARSAWNLLLFAAMIDTGAICRSKDAIIKCADEEQGRVCRVIAVVPEHRWRTPGVPEYKVELVALPVTAFRRDHELTLVPPADAMFSEQQLG